MRTFPILAVLLTACTLADPDIDLVIADGWRMADAEEDPFEGRPTELACDDSAVAVETGVLELTTSADCTWITVVQEAVAAVDAGSPLDMVVFHSALANPEAATAFMEVRLSATTLWSYGLALPAESGVYPFQGDAPADLEVGDPVYFHVDNHGSNAYRLAHLRAVPSIR